MSARYTYFEWDDAEQAVALDALTVVLMQHTGVLPAQEGLVIACMTR